MNVRISSAGRPRTLPLINVEPRQEGKLFLGVQQCAASPLRASSSPKMNLSPQLHENAVTGGAAQPHYEDASCAPCDALLKDAMDGRLSDRRVVACRAEPGREAPSRIPRAAGLNLAANRFETS